MACGFCVYRGLASDVDWHRLKRSRGPIDTLEPSAVKVMCRTATAARAWSTRTRAMNTVNDRLAASANGHDLAYRAKPSVTEGCSS